MTKADLKMYRARELELLQLQLRLQRLRLALEQCSQNSAGFEGLTRDCAVLTSQYTAALGAQTAELVRLEDAIEQDPYPAERFILRARYLDGRAWSDISAQLGYSERQVFRLHGYALLRLKEGGN